MIHMNQHQYNPWTALSPQAANAFIHPAGQRKAMTVRSPSVMLLCCFLSRPLSLSPSQSVSSSLLRTWCHFFACGLPVGSSWLYFNTHCHHSLAGNQPVRDSVLPWPWGNTQTHSEVCCSIRCNPYSHCCWTGPQVRVKLFFINTVNKDEHCDLRL